MSIFSRLLALEQSVNARRKSMFTVLFRTGEKRLISPDEAITLCHGDTTEIERFDEEPGETGNGRLKDLVNGLLDRTQGNN